MDQWPSKFSESFGLDRYWSIECSSLPGTPAMAAGRLPPGTARTVETLVALKRCDLSAGH